MAEDPDSSGGPASAAPMLNSMTGFARAAGATETDAGARSWVLEVKSVNGRGLEVRVRAPSGLDNFEQKARAAVQARFGRGVVNLSLSMKSEAAAAAPAIDMAGLARARDLIKKTASLIDCDPPRPEGVLAIPGVLKLEAPEDDEAARAALDAALDQTLAEALDGLIAARAEEGRALADILTGAVDDIERLTAEARQSAGAAPQMIRDRIAAQLSELLADGAVAEDRLAQEAAMLAVKADVREELDRLDAHVAAARALFAAGGPVGRKLDFLSQEFNREANTLCSKAQDMGLKGIGLELKSVIDQLREQVQNVE